MSGNTEPTITINGHQLTPSQVATFRVAMSSFNSEMTESHRLGPDEHSEILRNGYLKHSYDILRLLGT